MATRINRDASFGLLPLLAAALALGAPVVAAAAEPCPAGNLLAGKAPVTWQDIRGRLEVATDGVKAPEGAIWDAPLALVLDSGAASLTWDLGAAIPLEAAWIQADANDRYTVWGSIDGRRWQELGRVETASGHGLRGRELSLGRALVRFLRFGEGEGDHLYSLAEIQLFCQLPAVFPPEMPIGNARTAAAARSIYTYWNDTTSARWELCLALLGLALLQWGFVLHRRGRPDAWKKLRDRLLGLLGVLAALTYVNFGFFHFGNFIHTHEWTHYYLGSKYFRELSYVRLYDCISTSDAEDGLRRRVERRRTTDLRTNILQTSADVLAHPERCKGHFSATRWQSFKRDSAFFRARLSPRYWDDLQLDHGYNATPLWNAAGTLLTNLSPASNTQLHALALLDPLYLIGTIAVVGWAFGWRVLAVALLAFATNFPSRFYWNGGSFLRWDWLFYTVAAVCCLRKRRPLLGGAALAYATGLRVFPIFLFVGPALAAGWQIIDGRRRHGPGTPKPPALTRCHARFFLGAALAGALLLPFSWAVSGGATAYRAFIENTAKHKETPLVNAIGLRTVLAWRPSEVGRFLNDSRLLDPWSRWKEARLRSWRQARPLYLALALGALVLVALAVRRTEPWAAVALGVMLVPVGVELTSYYYTIILAIALLHEQREEVGRWLLCLTGFTQLVAWAPIRGMSRWADEQYTLMSAATVVVFAAIVWIFRDPAAPATQRSRTRTRSLPGTAYSS